MNLDTDSLVPVHFEIGLACKEGGEAPEEGAPSPTTGPEAGGSPRPSLPLAWLDGSVPAA
jgi:hypothetical protein